MALSIFCRVRCQSKLPSEFFYITLVNVATTKMYLDFIYWLLKKLDHTLTYIFHEYDKLKLKYDWD